MNENILRALYKNMKCDRETTYKAIREVQEFEEYLKNEDKTFESANIEDIKTYLEILINKKRNSISRILAIARYFYLLKRNEIYIYFTSILGGIGVVDNIKKRTLLFEGEKIKELIFSDIKEPPVGSSLKDIPYFTKKIMDTFISNLPEERFQKILAGNNHRLSREPMLKEKEIYENFDSIDQHLKDRHRRNVSVLQEHCDENKVWFEQKITQKVVDFVKENQEILSAVIKNNKLYVTKIPYDPDSYLLEKDTSKKKYFACHCPFVRESILNNELDIPADWCYCSAGFAKFPFEVIFNRELEVKVLQSVLKGDIYCRFSIKLNN